MKPAGVLKRKSQACHEQMKGRGTRVISCDELHKLDSALSAAHYPRFRS